MSIREIGCCGAYCKTCRSYTTGNNCRGCKLGYESGERDINKAKCKIKVCCCKEKNLKHVLIVQISKTVKSWIVFIKNIGRDTNGQ